MVNRFFGHPRTTPCPLGITCFPSPSNPPLGPDLHHPTLGILPRVLFVGPISDLSLTVTVFSHRISLYTCNPSTICFSFTQHLARFFSLVWTVVACAVRRLGAHPCQSVKKSGIVIFQIHSSTNSERCIRYAVVGTIALFINGTSPIVVLCSPHMDTRFVVPLEWVPVHRTVPPLLPVGGFGTMSVLPTGSIRVLKLNISYHLCGANAPRRHLFLSFYFFSLLFLFPSTFPFFFPYPFSKVLVLFISSLSALFELHPTPIFFLNSSTVSSINQHIDPPPCSYPTFSLFLYLSLSPPLFIRFVGKVPYACTNYSRVYSSCGFYPLFLFSPVHAAPVLYIVSLRLYSCVASWSPFSRL